MVVTVFVDSLHPDFLFPEVDGLVMERVRIKFQIGRWIEFVLVFRYNTNKIPADVWLATDWQPKAGSVHS